MYNIKPEKTIIGTINCENCAKEIKWHYVIHPKEFGIYLYSLPTDTRNAIKIQPKDDSDNTYSVRCPYCDKNNIFEYIEE